MQVKICGIKNIEAAEASIENGANYLGFNFIKSSKRLISAEDSLLIVNKLRKSFPNKNFKCVGLFDKELFSEVEKIVEYSKLDMIQLCGDGDMDSSIPSIIQIRIKPEDKEDEIANDFPPWKRTSIDSESTEEESETNNDEGRMIDLPYGLFDD